MREVIYSPEASDGTSDWPSKIGLGIWIFAGIGLLVLLLGGCATSTKLTTRTPDPSLMVPCETPQKLPAKPTGNQVDKALVDTTRIALECKNRHDGLIQFELAAPKG
jgi:hypothetical protein